MDSRPIGIFDSGIGGLTVAAAIKDHLPEEQIVYFGDTAHLPYGEKSPSALRSFATDVSKFLISKNCKAIVIACNSASAVAANTVKLAVGNTVPVINVIDPTVEYVSSRFHEKKIGVIATKATVNSRVYAKRIEKKNSSLKVTMLATPLLVAMIEEGFFNNSISRAVINSYLSKSNLKDVAGLILGCTHFPLIKKEVEAFYKNSTEVIDSTEIVANYTATVLKKRGIESKKRIPRSKHHFYVSDLTESFKESTQLFFGKQVRLEKKNLWA